MPAATSTTNIVDVRWPNFKRYFYGTWNQGQHVSLIGPTGQGKTTLALQLLPRREYVVVLGTKVKDTTLQKLVKKNKRDSEGYTRIEKWEDRRLHNRLLLWPRMGHEKDIAVQRREFSKALNHIYREGNWCVYVDEARYFTDMLSMKRLMVLFWTQGRSNGISFVTGTQRPAWVPTEIYDQADHIFFYGDNDEKNLKRIGGVGYLNSKEIQLAVAALERYQVLYINTRNGTMIRTKVEL